MTMHNTLEAMPPDEPATTLSHRIRLTPEFVLDREGIVIARYAGHPRIAFGLTEQSRLAGYPVAHLTVARALHPNGGKRSDLVTLRLRNAADARLIGNGDVWLDQIEVYGGFP